MFTEIDLIDYDRSMTRTMSQALMAALAASREQMDRETAAVRGRLAALDAVRDQLVADIALQMQMQLLPNPG